MIEVKIEIVGLSDLTDTLNLLASAIATQKDMHKTAAVLGEMAKPKEKEVEGEIRRPEVVADVKEIMGDEPEEIEEVEAVEELDGQVAMDEPTVTLDEIRAYLVTKIKQDNTVKAKAKDILDKYGYPNVSSLKPEHFEAVYRELEAL